FAFLAAAFTIVFFDNAWIGDDAYISFRTIDNFVSGYGLRWNVVERAQAYTHPLWVLLCSIPYFFTREVFYTVIVTSFVVCLGAFIVFRAGIRRAERWKAALLILVVLASKTFMDWSSSGLENPLSAFWAFLFVISVRHAAEPRASRRLLSIASLAYVTRQ